MQRAAQKRESRLRKILTTDIGDYIGGKEFEKSSPEFAKVVQEMNGTDELVRSVALGQGEKDSLKDLLKQIKSNINRREYMKAVSDLGIFHKRMFDITIALNHFKKNIDKTHEQFLFHGLDEDTKSYLKSFRGKWASEVISDYFIKQASILDFFHNIGTERGRALAGWEKRYPHKVKKLRDGAIASLSSAEKMLNTLLANLKLMDKARTIRNPDAYINLSSKILDHFKGYDSAFKGFYDNNVKEMLEAQDFFKPVTTVAPTSAPAAVPVVAPTAPVDMTKTMQQPMKAVIPALPPVPSMKPVPAPGQQLVQHVDDDGTITYIDKATMQEVPTGQTPPPVRVPFDPRSRQEGTTAKFRIGAQHASFYNSLEAMADESPVLLASHISKYAQSIRESDTETAIELLKVVASIRK